MQKLLSVIIPAYYEEGMIEQAAAEISAVLAENPHSKRAGYAYPRDQLFAQFRQGSGDVCGAFGSKGRCLRTYRL